MKKTVILGLSGGLDSLVSALLLKEKGWNVKARYFNLWKDDKSAKQAQNLAEKLNIDFKIIELNKPFKDKIVNPFIQDYIKGETPNPCVWCNHQIKIYYLYQEMLNSNADSFATGHYVRIKKHISEYHIFKGIDNIKDQSYFLWSIKSKYLKHWLTPLGDYSKQEIREIAIKNKMGFLAHKKESMGICFIGKEGYHQFIQKHKPPNVEIKKGVILDLNNNIIGTHKGTPFYTIGQKKNLNLNNKQSVVVAINANNNSLTVGENNNLYVNEFRIRDYFFRNIEDITNSNIKVWVRGIGQNPQKNCEIIIIDSLYLKIKLNDSAWALAKGQPVAFYIKDRLIGGGYIS